MADEKELKIQRQAARARERIMVNVKLYGTAAIFGTLTYFLYQRVPSPTPALNDVTKRLMFTIRWQLLSFFTMFLFMVDVALTRLVSGALDPINGNREHLVLAKAKILTNTVEQIIMNVFGQLVLATYLDSESMKIIPILVTWFVIGRILFKIGYPRQRTFGVSLTMFSTLATYFYCFYCFYKHGMTFGVANKEF